MLKQVLIFTIGLFLMMADVQSNPANNQIMIGSSNKNFISVNFQDISVRAVLQLLADFSKTNIIVSDEVTGNITIHLENIDWQQALDLVLQTEGLAKRQLGNALFIAPITTMMNREKQFLLAQQQTEDLAPIQSELITMRFGKAVDVANVLKSQSVSLLSSRGRVSVDMRTNTLWIEETAKKLAEINAFIKKLDIPVKQVLIEARIVNLDCNYEQELGVKFNVTHNQTPIPPPITGQFHMDLSANPIGGIQPATFGLAIARLGAGTLLDLELSALESEGAGQIISSPRLITADQQTAQIQSGEEIPYQQSTSGGATNIAFKDAVLSLNVTPQITPGNKIMLALKINQDKVGSRLVQGVPSIDTRELETQILVDDGETVVLGGIYETDHKNHVDRVSFLGALPVVGSLFRHRSIDNSKKELLIFVTPHVLSS